ncbi:MULTISPECIES: dihydropteroate synthase [Clostridium]|uniref:Dihydropteroate synthase n=1 Tax=Clostridium butyricum E4 str. BoNT E BL5262 TaxID=632245 RepID=C4ID46_CLOBU|nr:MULTISPECIES: dihydropteroate synthase [Clostridium]APF22235.1 dihydropteroate synthase [Clostridium butyricum]AXB83637.1 dihydropteroate synthase [Clostridium butyricum]EDT75474.1 dihydropteroate synthase [Clostridium butyricum 5521]EEP55762.1 dihydropteroate synthase [Clostridium butyricum E4 str. BoNT E BL5262]EMU56072.1 dihydropteroate synthase [Clostridium butyricum DKU-01]
MKIGNKEFKLGERTYVMGILNATPDSFSDGGKFNEVEIALKRVEEMISQGADIIDVGGESTRPNFTVVEVDDEINRVVPVIKAIKEKFDITVSIDTYKAKTAEAAIKAGADIINDVWGFKKDKSMASVAAKYDVPCILMHNREDKPYENLMEDVKNDLIESIKIAMDAGVKKENIILDPGIGFAKTYEENLIVMKNVKEIRDMGYPVLLGTSRKSMIGNTLNLPVDQRVEGTLVTTVMGIMSGCEFIRVHDVLENKRACIMTDKILSV